jgi:hypothetical protein
LDLQAFSLGPLSKSVRSQFVSLEIKSELFVNFISLFSVCSSYFGKDSFLISIGNYIDKQSKDIEFQIKHKKDIHSKQDFIFHKNKNNTLSLYLIYFPFFSSIDRLQTVSGGEKSVPK